MKRLLLLLMIVSCLLGISVTAAADNNTVTLTAEGDFTAALDTVPDGGTIRVEGTVTVPKDFAWENHSKTITFSGDMLSFTKNRNIVLGDNVRFENIKLMFADGGFLYANGHSLYIGEDVTTVGEITIYGGGRLKPVSSTNMTLLGGTYTAVYGGGCNADVTGDVNLTIGGKFNESMGSITHKHTYCVYGGGFKAKVHGDVNLSFGGNAKANYIYGGASGINSRVLGTIKLHFSGGTAMSICGGSYDVDQQSDVELLFDGGEVQQIFGGCEKSSMIGDIHIQILGGKITRRIYGGCYNNYDGSWEDPGNFVYGNILLTLGANADLALNYKGNDLSVYAHSRHKSPPKTEVAHINYADIMARINLSDKLGAQDGLMKGIMWGAKTCDEEHILTHSISGNIITQHCRYHENATATIHVKNAEYTGTAIENATVTLSDNWIGPAPVLTYSNNINMGLAHVTVTLGDVSATYDFQIHGMESADSWIVWAAIGTVVLISALLGATFFIYKQKTRLEH